MTFKYLKNKIYVQTGIKPLDCYHILRETQSKWKLCLDFYKCNSEMRELQRSINTYNVRYFSTACSFVYNYCTRPISKHLYSGIFKDPLNRK